MLSIITGLARSRNLHAVLLCAFAAVLAVACDKVPLLAPRESTITLSSASTVVQANGTTQIHAIVIEPSGTPVHDGTTVLFTTSLGTLVPVEARTQNGVATVQFLGNGQSGKATIKALSGGSASEALELSVGAGASGRVSVTANPASVPASGGTTTISAAVADASGNLLSGVPVSFATTAGTFSSAVVNTDASGTARTTLTTSQAASVTATAGGTTSTALNITVTSLPDITITPSPAAPTEGQPVTFTIALTGTATTETFQSLSVDFGDGITIGPLSGTNQNVSHVYDRSGTYLVEVTGTSASGNTKRATTSISVADRGIVDVRIDRVPTPNGKVGQPITFTATASGGGSVRSYSWNFGDGPPFTGGSQVSHTYNTMGTKQVTVTVTTTDGNSGRGQTQFIVEPVEP